MGPGCDMERCGGRNDSGLSRNGRLDEGNVGRCNRMVLQSGYSRGVVVVVVGVAQRALVDG